MTSVHFQDKLFNITVCIPNTNAKEAEVDQFYEDLQDSLVTAQSLSRVQLLVTPWTAAHQGSLSFTISLNLLKLLSVESAMPSNHLISVTPFSCSQSFPASGSFPMSQLFAPAAGEGIQMVLWSVDPGHVSSLFGFALWTPRSSDRSQLLLLWPGAKFLVVTSGLCFLS